MFAIIKDMEGKWQFSFLKTFKSSVICSLGLRKWLKKSLDVQRYHNITKPVLMIGSGNINMPRTKEKTTKVITINHL